MKTFLPKAGFLTFVFLIANLFFANGSFGQATVTTDKDDYAPGEYVIITGSGWYPGETVLLHLDETPKPVTCLNPHNLSATADANGNIYNNLFLIRESHLGVAFLLTATGQTSGLIATRNFTDGRAEISSVAPSPFSPNQITSTGVKDNVIITGFNNGAIGGNNSISNFNVRVKNSSNVLVWNSGNVNIANGSSSNFNWNGTYSTNGSGFVPDGIYTAIATNNTNESTNPASITKQIIVDNTNPTIVNLPANQIVNSTAGVCGALVTWTSPTVFDANANAAITQTSGSASGTIFPIGVTTIAYKAIDDAGNNVSSSFTITVNDTEVPTISCVSNQIKNTDTGTCAYTVVGTEFDPTVFADNCTGSTIKNNYNNTASLAGAVFPKGTTTVIWTVTDGATIANTASCSFTVTVNDTEKPIIVSNGDKNVNTDLETCGATVLVSASATDNCSVGMPTGIRSDGLALNALYPVGNTTITWNVSDTTGNPAVAVIQTVTVVDNQAPVAITQPVTISLDASGQASVTAAQVNNASTDNCGVVSWTLDKSSFDCSNLGANTVTLTVKDVTGNIGAASAIVTVIDSEKPIITAPSNINVSNDVGACGATIIIAIPLATDNCFVGIPIGTRSDGLALNEIYPVGTTIITWNAIDSFGNLALAKTQTIVVTDAQLPSITCPDNITLSACVSTASWTAPLATDNCPGVTVVQTAGPESGSTFANGSTTIITYTATDGVGNKKSCSFTVTRAAVLTASASPSTILCNDGISNVVITALGGTTPYTGVGTFEHAAGSYSYNVTDAAGCLVNVNGTITAPSAVSITSAIKTSYKGSDLSCATATDGKITVAASGGVGGLQYSKDNGVTYQSSNIFNGLAAGTYQIKVMDANSCTSSAVEVAIIAPTTLLATITTNNPALYYGYAGDQTATITATPSGGTAPYTIKITMMNGATTTVAPAAVRNNGKLICNFINSAGNEVWASGLNTNSALSTGITCGTNSVTASSTSNPVYSSYSVNVTLLADARFLATVTDANGCTYTTPYDLAARVDAEDVRCFAGNSGVVKVAICHQTGSAKNPCIAICVDQSAVQEHLNHGDFLGKCTSTCKAPVSNAKTPHSDKMLVEATVTDIDPTEFAVKVFPNPTDNQFTLVLEGGSSEKIEVLVYDMLARKVKRIEKNENQPIVFGEEFPVGEYIVLIRQGDNAKTLNLIKK